MFPSLLLLYLLVLLGRVDLCLPFDFAQGTFLRWLSGVEASVEVIELRFFKLVSEK
jgi:hypothetical protein